VTSSSFLASHSMNMQSSGVRFHPKLTDELEVLCVAPSERAIWRLRRQTARASGRPRLAVRRVIAAAAVATASEPLEVVEVGPPIGPFGPFGCMGIVRPMDAVGAMGPSKRKCCHNPISDKDATPKRRRKRSQTPTRAQTPSACQWLDLKIAQSELAQLKLQKMHWEIELAAERGRSNDSKVQFESCLAVEKRRNQGLREKLESVEWQNAGALREKTRLMKQVQELQRLSQVSRAPVPVVAPTQNVLAKQIADMECRPLRDKNAKERAVLKKKLLVKWHPDKQPSSDHAVVATSVVQEMQNCSEWKL